MQGAEAMGQMEHLLNVYASKAAKGSTADFVGYVEVSEEQATTKLTQGVWLVNSTPVVSCKCLSAIDPDDYLDWFNSQCLPLHTAEMSMQLHRTQVRRKKHVVHPDKTRAVITC